MICHLYFLTTMDSRMFCSQESFAQESFAHKNLLQCFFCPQNLYTHENVLTKTQIQTKGLEHTHRSHHHYFIGKKHWQFPHDLKKIAHEEFTSITHHIHAHSTHYRTQTFFSLIVTKRERSFALTKIFERRSASPLGFCSHIRKERGR